MRNMENNADKFWNRVDSVRQETLAVICEKSGVNLGTLKGLRKNSKYPNLMDTVALAEYLGCTLDWLVLGVTPAETQQLEDILLAYVNADLDTKHVVNRILGV